MNVKDVYGVEAPRVSAYPAGKIQCVYPELVIGLELETEQVGYSQRTYNDLLSKVNFKAVEDGSLQAPAYEFISKPMRSDSCLAALDDYFKLTKFNEKNYSDRCSVHVHVNCTDMEFEKISNVALLYTVFEELLFEFVGHDRDSNLYCVPWNQCRMHLNLINSFLKDATQVLRAWNKYTAVNLLPLSTLGTIEFRQMHGTADMEKLTKWINLLGAIFKYAKGTELKDLITEIKNLNNTSLYAQFFEKVLANQLPYNDVYQSKMEEGIIFAKYSLTNFQDKPAVKATRNPAAEANPYLDVLRPGLVGQAEDLYREFRNNPLIAAGAQQPMMQPPPAPRPIDEWIQAAPPARQHLRPNRNNAGRIVRNVVVQAEAAERGMREIIREMEQNRVVRAQQQAEGEF